MHYYVNVEISIKHHLEPVINLMSGILICFQRQSSRFTKNSNCCVFTLAVIVYKDAISMRWPGNSIEAKLRAPRTPPPRNYALPWRKQERIFISGGNGLNFIEVNTRIAWCLHYTLLYWWAKSWGTLYVNSCHAQYCLAFSSSTWRPIKINLSF